MERQNEKQKIIFSKILSSPVRPEENAYLKSEMRGLSSDSAGKVLAEET